MQVLLSTPIYIQPYIYIAIYWVAVLQKKFKEGLIKKKPTPQNVKGGGGGVVLHRPGAIKKYDIPIVVQDY